MNERKLRNLIADVKAGRLSRRAFVQRMIAVGLTAPMAGMMLSQSGMAMAATAIPYKPTRADGGSDRFIDAMVLWGDAETVKRGLRAHFDAGATHVCLQPVHADGDFAARDRMLAALADT